MSIWHQQSLLRRNYKKKKLFCNLDQSHWHCYWHLLISVYRQLCWRLLTLINLSFLVVRLYPAVKVGLDINTSPKKWIWHYIPNSMLMTSSGGLAGWTSVCPASSTGCSPSWLWSLLWGIGLWGSWWPTYGPSTLDTARCITSKFLKIYVFHSYVKHQIKGIKLKADNPAPTSLKLLSKGENFLGGDSWDLNLF